MIAKADHLTCLVETALPSLWEADVYVACDRIVGLKPDVLRLDVEMPSMDGVQFLKRLVPQYPIPAFFAVHVIEHGRG